MLAQTRPEWKKGYSGLLFPFSLPAVPARLYHQGERLMPLSPFDVVGVFSGEGSCVWPGCVVQIVVDVELNWRLANVRMRRRGGGAGVFDQVQEHKFLLSETLNGFLGAAPCIVREREKKETLGKRGLSQSGMGEIDSLTKGKEESGRQRNSTTKAVETGVSGFVSFFFLIVLSYGYGPFVAVCQRHISGINSSSSTKRKRLVCMCARCKVACRLSRPRCPCAILFAQQTYQAPS
ncbi:hypothetical protein BDP81DRAFT_107518 [Colletotrichum phormii]|uniref:Uncharacterized protein n=1 Tax=Colletotrichum phormii TaxID=359342 RepID=A0AAJ0EAM7_9PEZI|nr:uncharacterized protein BDP81DRAFT_107518 [Colletotrichum phormii]KAK1624766.1 hypothetical protein BDP81DRAFT_107518 [Colletotrichum phormii]